MKKPNQIIDEITGVIYPPAEAIPGQLDTIKVVAASTKKIYDATGDVHSIFPNLDMIQRAIDYLKGAPMRDELKPIPEDTLKPIYIPSSSGFNITSAINRDGEYDVSIVGIDVEQKIDYPELFGEVDFPAVEMGIEFPVICGKTYLVAQENPVLENYENDPSIKYYEDQNAWIKEKEYPMDEDYFKYMFLLQEGRSKVRIAVYADHEEPIVFNITSHIHIKEEEIAPEPGQGDNKDEENSGTNG